MKYLLMIPGPVETPDEITDVFNGQTIAHYGKEFRDLYIDTTQKLSNVLGTKGCSFLIPGSGSTALEAIGLNFCDSKRCLIINNGHFGDRIYDIASKYAASTDQITFKKGRSYDLKVIEDYLKKNQYDLLWMVHVDTSIGILNPLKEVAVLSEKYGTRVFVDAIASSAIEEIQMDNWGIDCIANASQKGFSCPAGFGLLTVGDNLVKQIKPASEIKGWCLNLGIWIEYYNKWNDWHPYPVTLPTNLVKALNKSLELIEIQGIGNRVAMYKDVSDKLIRSVRKLGLDLFVPEPNNAHGLTAVSTLGKFDASDFKEFIRDRYKIQIGGSLDKNMKSLVFRIGHMSTKQCLSRNLVSVMSALGTYMKLKNIEADTGEAISVLI